MGQSRFLTLLFASVSLTGSVRAADPPDQPTYWQDVRPVLRKYCIVCHSAKNAKEIDVSGGLALDTYESALKGTKREVIQPGKSAASELFKLIVTQDEDKRMPLGARPLPEEAITLIRRWIDAGANEGKQPDAAATPVASTTTRHARKLDVVLPTNTIPPKGFFGSAAPAKLELSLKVGPLSPVTAVAFSPDHKLLAVGSYGRVTLWDMATMRPEKVLTNVLAAVNDVRFSPDGKLLAVAGGQPSAKGDLRLYQVAEWKLLATLAGHEDVAASVAFHPNGKQIASASFDKTVRLWDLETRKEVLRLTGHSDFVHAVAFSLDGKWLFSTSKDRTVRMIDSATGKSRFTFSGMDQDVLAVAVSPDGKHAVSSGLESGLYWWNPQTGQRVRVQGGHGVAVHEICFSKDGALLASAGGDGTVRLWNGANGAAQQTLSAGSIVYAVAISPDGKQVAAGCFDGFVRLWDTAKGRQLLTLLSLPPRGEESDWLAATPEGYFACSSGLGALGQWRMSGDTVPAEAICKFLGQQESVAKAARGEPVPAPTFEK